MKLGRTAALTAAALAFGGCGCVLSRVMEATAMDEKGLLLPWHWTVAGCLALAVLFAGFLWIVFRKTGELSMYRELFPGDRFRGALAAAGGLVMALYSLDQIDQAQLLLGLACALGMMTSGVFRWMGKRPPVVLHCGLCVYWVAALVLQYPKWSGSSQLYRYVGQLLALIGLMLYAYHRCAADAGQLQPRLLGVSALTALGLSVFAMSHPATRLWYLSSALWVAGSMGTLAQSKTQALVELYERKASHDPQGAFAVLLVLLERLDAQGFVLLGPTFARWIPELEPCLGFDQRTPHHAYDVYTHTACVAAALPPDGTLRLAALLHDVGKPQCLRLDSRGRGHFKGHAIRSAALAQPILQRLGAPEQTALEVRWLIARHMITAQNPKAMAVVERQAQEGWLERLTLLQAADARGKTKATASTVKSLRFKSC